MKEFPTIVAMLKTSFNAEDGLSEDVSIRLYRKMAILSGDLKALKEELEMAFSSKDVSWKEILYNDDYEFFYAETENEARDYAQKILWNSIFYEYVQLKSR